MATPWLPSYLITALLEREALPVGGFGETAGPPAPRQGNHQCATRDLNNQSREPFPVRNEFVCEKATGRDPSMESI